MKIVFLFYEGMTALDAVGPLEILSRIPNATVQRAALNTGLVNTDSGLFLNSEVPLSEISHADILVIPGAGSATSLENFPEILQWVASIHTTTLWTTSVCTGSLILGASGILKGVKATTHWAAHERLQKWGAKPVHERVVVDGKVMTAAGVSAGIDMALALTEKAAGLQVAQTLQLGLEYDPAPPFNTGSPEKAPKEMVAALKKRMNASFEVSK
ncbi:MAG: DJ-1/PfpI family protein [Simkaniaceae bacterium]|nr:DJ-1/PfpI family protein [Candidatus Sacchlamyda saccharinae]